MRVRAALSQSVLGVFVIVHALAHGAIPMRGGVDPTTAVGLVTRLLFSVAVACLTLAGLGLLRVPVLQRVTQPALVLGAAYSLIALGSGAPGPIWPALVISAVLLVVGVSRAYRYLPEASSSGSIARRVVRIAGITVLTYGAAAVLLWPAHRGWGSLPGEYMVPLPGDHPDRNAGLELQHAVTVQAPPEAVWAWLVQLGQDRAGFYTYDWLERAFGVDIHNVTQIRAEWQERRAGERVRATQPDYLGGVLGKDLGWTITQIEPGRAMVLQQWGAFVLQRTPEGHTRFIIRTKVGDPRMPAWAAALDIMLFEMPHFIMERRMMLQIKALAESTTTPRVTARADNPSALRKFPQVTH